MTRGFLLTTVALSWLVFSVGCAEPAGEELLAEARAAVAKGDVRTATIHLRNLLRAEPANANARFLLGQVLLEQDPAEAEAALRRALELGQDPASVQLPLLRALLLQGRFGDLIALAESGPQLQGADGVTVQRLVVQAHRGANRPREAETAVRAAIAANPGSKELRSDLASLLLSQNRLDEGRRVIVEVLTEDPAFVPALTLRGTLESVSDRLDDAERTLREAVERGGTNAESYFSAMIQLVDVLVAKDDLAAAETASNELLARFPQHPVAVAGKANVELRKGDVEAAKQRLAQLLSVVPAFGPANRLFGIVNAELGEIEQAEMFFQRALVQVPDDRRALLYLAELHLAQNETEDARDVLASALGADTPLSNAVAFALGGAAAFRLHEDDLGDKLLEHAAKALSGDPEELLSVAAVFVNTNRAERARELLSASPENDEAWMAAFGLALTQVQQRDFAAADATTARLIELQPDAAWPLNLRGMIAASRQDFDTAITFFSAAYAKEPKYVAAVLNRARMHALAGRPAEAVKDYEVALAANPGNPSALIALAEIAIQQRNFGDARRWIQQIPETALERQQFEGSLALAEGRFDEAADKLLALFEARPSSDRAVQAFAAAQRAGRPNPEAPLVAWVAERPRDVRANYMLGTLALQAGDRDRAVRYYETVVDVDPQQAQALNNLAWLYGERGQGARALEIAKRAHAAAPNEAPIADTLGWLHVQQGNAREGLPLLEQSHGAVPEHPGIHYHYAAALAKTGARQRAADELRKLLAAHERFDERAEAEQLLREVE